MILMTGLSTLLCYFELIMGLQTKLRRWLKQYILKFHVEAEQTKTVCSRSRNPEARTAISYAKILLALVPELEWPRI